MGHHVLGCGVHWLVVEFLLVGYCEVWEYSVVGKYYAGVQGVPVLFWIYFGWRYGGG